MTNPKPKHEKIRTWFNLKASKGMKLIVNGERLKMLTVRPYNAETTSKHPRNVSWSHGFTHFEIKETGTTGFCGTNFFEENAKPIKVAKNAK